MARRKFISREGPTHRGIDIEDFTSIEVYFAAGGVFLAGFTFSLILTRVLQIEHLVWFGWALSLVLALTTFFVLRARELRHRAKIDQVTPPPKWRTKASDERRR
jgi:hypothetical protein